MHPSRLLATATFRLALSYASLFALSSALLFYFVYGAMTQFETEQLRKSIVVETNALLAEAPSRDTASVRTIVAARLRAIGYRRFRYALIAKDGGQQLGNLDAVPGRSGWTEPKAQATEFIDVDATPPPLYILGTELTDGGRLFVAQDTKPLEELGETVTGAFTLGGAGTAGLAVLGGLAVSALFLRRIGRINTAAMRFIEGNLAERIPDHGTYDEFDRLAGNLNNMLDRIQTLMAGIKHATSDIAHDLRTPLTRLRQGLEQARGGNLSAADVQKVIDSAIADTDDILRTFSALLRISEIEAGERRAGFTTLDLSKVFQRLADTYTPVAEDAGYSLRSNIAPGIVVQGDGDLITQMLANLIENALRHTPPGTTLAIALRRDGNAVTGEVADSGPGIPPEAREVVFRPLYRLDQSRSTEGSGLGLALVAAIAELHGATVTLSDATPGARFEIAFASPLADGERTASETRLAGNRRMAPARPENLN